jgi:hypothetical protein
MKFPTVVELVTSEKFWQKRVDEQLTYLRQVRERTDLTPERKEELAQSAFDIYMKCQGNLNFMRNYWREFNSLMRSLNERFQL